MAKAKGYHSVAQDPTYPSWRSHLHSVIQQTEHNLGASRLGSAGALNAWDELGSSRRTGNQRTRPIIYHGGTTSGSSQGIFTGATYDSPLVSRRPATTIAATPVRRIDDASVAIASPSDVQNSLRSAKDELRREMDTLVGKVRSELRTGAEILALKESVRELQSARETTMDAARDNNDADAGAAAETPRRQHRHLSPERAQGRDRESNRGAGTGNSHAATGYNSTGSNTAPGGSAGTSQVAMERIREETKGMVHDAITTLRGEIMESLGLRTHGLGPGNGLGQAAHAGAQLPRVDASTDTLSLDLLLRQAQAMQGSLGGQGVPRGGSHAASPSRSDLAHMPAGARPHLAMPSVPPYVQAMPVPSYPAPVFATPVAVAPVYPPGRGDWGGGDAYASYSGIASVPYGVKEGVFGAGGSAGMPGTERGVRQSGPPGGWFSVSDAGSGGAGLEVALDDARLAALEARCHDAIASMHEGQARVEAVLANVQAHVGDNNNNSSAGAGASALDAANVTAAAKRAAEEVSRATAADVAAKADARDAMLRTELASVKALLVARVAALEEREEARGVQTTVEGGAAPGESGVGGSSVGVLREMEALAGRLCVLEEAVRGMADKGPAAQREALRPLEQGMGELRASVEKLESLQVSVRGLYELRAAVEGIEPLRASVAGLEKLKSSVAGIDRLKASVEGFEKMRPSIEGFERLKRSVEALESLRASLAGYEKVKACAEEVEGIKTSVAGLEKLRSSVVALERDSIARHADTDVELSKLKLVAKDAASAADIALVALKEKGEAFAALETKLASATESPAVVEALRKEMKGEMDGVRAELANVSAAIAQVKAAGGGEDGGGGGPGGKDKEREHIKDELRKFSATLEKVKHQAVTAEAAAQAAEMVAKQMRRESGLSGSSGGASSAPSFANSKEHAALIEASEKLAGRMAAAEEQLAAVGVAGEAARAANESGRAEMREELADAVASLREGLANMGASLGSDIGALRGSVGEVREQLASTTGDQEERDAAVKRLAGRVEEVSKELMLADAAAATRIEVVARSMEAMTGSTESAVGELRQQAARLEERSGSVAGELARVRDELAAVKEAASKQAAASDEAVGRHGAAVSRVEAEVADVRSALARLEQALEQVAEAGRGQRGGEDGDDDSVSVLIKEQVAGLVGDVEALRRYMRERQEGDASSEQVDELRRRIAEMEEQMVAQRDEVALLADAAKEAQASAAGGKSRGVVAPGVGEGGDSAELKDRMERLEQKVERRLAEVLHQSKQKQGMGDNAGRRQVMPGAWWAQQRLLASQLGQLRAEVALLAQESVSAPHQLGVQLGEGVAGARESLVAARELVRGVREEAEDVRRELVEVQERWRQQQQQQQAQQGLSQGAHRQRGALVSAAKSGDDKDGEREEEEEETEDGGKMQGGKTREGDPTALAVKALQARLGELEAACSSAEGRMQAVAACVEESSARERDLSARLVEHAAAQHAAMEARLEELEEALAAATKARAGASGSHPPAEDMHDAFRRGLASDTESRGVEGGSVAEGEGSDADDGEVEWVLNEYLVEFEEVAAEVRALAKEMSEGREGMDALAGEVGRLRAEQREALGGLSSEAAALEEQVRAVRARADAVAGRGSTSVNARGLGAAAGPGLGGPGSGLGAEVPGTGVGSHPGGVAREAKDGEGKGGVAGGSSTLASKVLTRALLGKESLGDSAASSPRGFLVNMADGDEQSDGWEQGGQEGEDAGAVDDEFDASVEGSGGGEGEHGALNRETGYTFKEEGGEEHEEEAERKAGGTGDRAVGEEGDTVPSAKASHAAAAVTLDTTPAIGASGTHIPPLPAATSSPLPSPGRPPSSLPSPVLPQSSSASPLVSPSTVGPVGGGQASEEVVGWRPPVIGAAAEEAKRMLSGTRNIRSMWAAKEKETTAAATAHPGDNLVHGKHVPPVAVGATGAAPSSSSSSIRNLWAQKEKEAAEQGKHGGVGVVAHAAGVAAAPATRSIRDMWRMKEKGLGEAGESHGGDPGPHLLVSPTGSHLSDQLSLSPATSPSQQGSRIPQIGGTVVSMGGDAPEDAQPRAVTAGDGTGVVGRVSSEAVSKAATTAPVGGQDEGDDGDERDGGGEREEEGEEGKQTAREPEKKEADTEEESQPEAEHEFEEEEVVEDEGFEEASDRGSADASDREEPPVSAPHAAGTGLSALVVKTRPGTGGDGDVAAQGDAGGEEGQSEGTPGAEREGEDESEREGEGAGGADVWDTPRLRSADEAARSRAASLSRSLRGLWGDSEGGDGTAGLQGGEEGSPDEEGSGGKGIDSDAPAGMRVHVASGGADERSRVWDSPKLREAEARARARATTLKKLWTGGADEEVEVGSGGEEVGGEGEEEGSGVDGGKGQEGGEEKEEEEQGEGGGGPKKGGMEGEEAGGGDKDSWVDGSQVSGEIEEEVAEEGVEESDGEEGLVRAGAASDAGSGKDEEDDGRKVSPRPCPEKARAGREEEDGDIGSRHGDDEDAAREGDGKSDWEERDADAMGKEEEEDEPVKRPAASLFTSGIPRLNLTGARLGVDLVGGGVSGGLDAPRGVGDASSPLASGTPSGSEGLEEVVEGEESGWSDAPSQDDKRGDEEVEEVVEGEESGWSDAPSQDDKRGDEEEAEQSATHGLADSQGGKDDDASGLGEGASGEGGSEGEGEPHRKAEKGGGSEGRHTPDGSTQGDDGASGDVGHAAEHAEIGDGATVCEGDDVPGGASMGRSPATPAGMDEAEVEEEAVSDGWGDEDVVEEAEGGEGEAVGGESGDDEDGASSHGDEGKSTGAPGARDGDDPAHSHDDAEKEEGDGDEDKDAARSPLASDEEQVVASGDEGGDRDQDDEDAAASEGKGSPGKADMGRDASMLSSSLPRTSIPRLNLLGARLGEDVLGGASEGGLAAPRQVPGGSLPSLASLSALPRLAPLGGGLDARRASEAEGPLAERGSRGKEDSSPVSPAAGVDDEGGAGPPSAARNGEDLGSDGDYDLEEEREELEEGKDEEGGEEGPADHSGGVSDGEQQGEADADDAWRGAQDAPGPDVASPRSPVADVTEESVVEESVVEESGSGWGSEVASPRAEETPKIAREETGQEEDGEGEGPYENEAASSGGTEEEEEDKEEGVSKPLDNESDADGVDEGNYAGKPMERDAGASADRGNQGEEDGPIDDEGEEAEDGNSSDKGSPHGTSSSSQARQFPPVHVMGRGRGSLPPVGRGGGLGRGSSGLAALMQRSGLLQGTVVPHGGASEFDDADDTIDVMEEYRVGRGGASPKGGAACDGEEEGEGEADRGASHGAGRQQVGRSTAMFDEEDELEAGVEAKGRPAAAPVQARAGTTSAHYDEEEDVASAEEDVSHRGHDKEDAEDEDEMEGGGIAANLGRLEPSLWGPESKQGLTTSARSLPPVRGGALPWLARSPVTSSAAQRQHDDIGSDDEPEVEMFDSGAGGGDAGKKEGTDASSAHSGGADKVASGHGEEDAHKGVGGRQAVGGGRKDAGGEDSSDDDESEPELKQYERSPNPVAAGIGGPAGVLGGPSRAVGGSRLGPIKTIAPLGGDDAAGPGVAGSDVPRLGPIGGRLGGIVAGSGSLPGLFGGPKMPGALPSLGGLGVSGGIKAQPWMRGSAKDEGESSDEEGGITSGGVGAGAGAGAGLSQARPAGLAIPAQGAAEDDDEFDIWDGVEEEGEGAASPEATPADVNGHGRPGLPPVAAPRGIQGGGMGGVPADEDDEVEGDGQGSPLGSVASEDIAAGAAAAAAAAREGSLSAVLRHGGGNEGNRYSHGEELLLASDHSDLLQAAAEDSSLGGGDALGLELEDEDERELGGIGMPPLGGMRGGHPHGVGAHLGGLTHIAAYGVEDDDRFGSVAGIVAGAEVDESGLLSEGANSGWSDDDYGHEGDSAEGTVPSGGRTAPEDVLQSAISEVDRAYQRTQMPAGEEDAPANGSPLQSQGASHGSLMASDEDVRHSEQGKASADEYDIGFESGEDERVVANLDRDLEVPVDDELDNDSDF